MENEVIEFDIGVGGGGRGATSGDEALDSDHHVLDEEMADSSPTGGTQSRTGSPDGALLRSHRQISPRQDLDRYPEAVEWAPEDYVTNKKSMVGSRKLDSTEDAMLQKLLNENCLTQEERDVLRWGKNIGSVKIRTKKRAGVAVYNRASSLETLVVFARNTDQIASIAGFGLEIPIPNSPISHHSHPPPPLPPPPPKFDPSPPQTHRHSYPQPPPPELFHLAELQLTSNSDFEAVPQEFLILMLQAVPQEWDQPLMQSLAEKFQFQHVRFFPEGTQIDPLDNHREPTFQCSVEKVPRVAMFEKKLLVAEHDLSPSGSVCLGNGKYGLWSAKYSLIVKMAFCNRFASIMRQTISQNSASIGQVPTASMLNAIRCMSSSKLFIGGLSYGTDDQSLRDAFSGFGDVVDAKVITDRETGKSRGFGFVNFTSDESATSAMSSMDGQPLDGRTVRVSYATERPSSGPRGNFGGGYSSGNYRGGYGDARENDRF
ncbi:hypothetical protein LOK49_Contig11G00032 [Camellia lanceoleosa]|nr:hypothetical protein LOK49_Contig11G00032 [Camellia lanceoleosa]